MNSVKISRKETEEHDPMDIKNSKSSSNQEKTTFNEVIQSIDKCFPIVSNLQSQGQNEFEQHYVDTMFILFLSIIFHTPYPNAIFVF